MPSLIYSILYTISVLNTGIHPPHTHARTHKHLSYACIYVGVHEQTCTRRICKGTRAQVIGNWPFELPHF